MDTDMLTYPGANIFEETSNYSVVGPHIEIYIIPDR